MCLSLSVSVCLHLSVSVCLSVGMTTATTTAAIATSATVIAATVVTTTGITAITAIATTAANDAEVLSTTTPSSKLQKRRYCQYQCGDVTESVLQHGVCPPPKKMRSALQNLSSTSSLGCPLATATPRSRSSALKIGAACAGYLSESFALDGLGVDHTYEWTFELDGMVRTLQQHVHKPKQVLGDVMQADVDKLAPVDVLVAGFPCQSFSTGGLQQGIRDLKLRGVVVFGILDIIAQLTPQPRLVLFENVYGLYLVHRAVLKKIVKVLQSLGYLVKVWIMNSLDHGVPQNRVRVWIAGLRRDVVVHEPTPPAPLQHLPSLVDGFLNMSKRAADVKLPKRAADLVGKVQAALDADPKPVDLQRHPVIVDNVQREVLQIQCRPLAHVDEKPCEAAWVLRAAAQHLHELGGDRCLDGHFARRHSQDAGVATTRSCHCWGHGERAERERVGADPGPPWKSQQVWW